MKTFKEFVMDQPADRVIDHKHGWYGCAVGDYAEEIQGLRKKVSFSESDWKRRVDEILQDFLLESSLQLAGRYVKWSNMFGAYIPFGVDVAINTYGDLQDYYKGKLELEVQSLI